MTRGRLPILPIWGLIAALCVGTVLAIAGNTYAQQRDTVEATSRVVLTSTRAPDRPSQQFNPAPTLLLTRSIESYSSLVASENFMRRVIDTHELDTTPAQLREAVSVTSPPDTTVMDFSVRGRDPEATMSAAAAIGQEFTRALADLESPTPIGSVVLDPVQATHTFPHSLMRTAVLTALAAIITMCVGAILGRRVITTGSRPASERNRTRTFDHNNAGGTQ